MTEASQTSAARTANMRKSSKTSTPSLLTRFSEIITGKKHLEAEILLKSFLELLDEDKRQLSRHPILKHLVARYEAFLKDEGPLEPHSEFRDRMNELTVRTLEKKEIKAKKYRRRTEKKSNEKAIKEAGRNKFERTERQRRNYETNRSNNTEFSSSHRY